MTAAAGPIGRVVETDGAVIKPRTGYQLGADANALIILNRLAFADHRGMLEEKSSRPLLRWAADTGLGQSESLVRDVVTRRARMLEDLRSAGRAVTRLYADPEWRLAIGLGNRANAHEVGFSLHGCYGWPVVPASALKGLAAAWAAASGASETDLRRVFGSPRPPGKGGAATEDRPARRLPDARGSVCFLDAIPADGPVTVTLDVLTPHVKPYYDATADARTGQPLPPAEHHNPVPVNFLTVSGAFSFDLYGPDVKDTGLAAEWLTAACDQLGAGAKTASGYGYLTLKPVPGWELQA